MEAKRREADNSEKGLQFIRVVACLGRGECQAALSWDSEHASSRGFPFLAELCCSGFAPDVREVGQVGGAGEVAES